MSQVVKTVRSPELEKAARDFYHNRTVEALERVVRHGEALVSHFACFYSPGRFDEDLKQAAVLTPTGAAFRVF